MLLFVDASVCCFFDLVFLPFFLPFPPFYKQLNYLRRIRRSQI